MILNPLLNYKAPKETTVIMVDCVQKSSGEKYLYTNVPPAADKDYLCCIPMELQYTGNISDYIGRYFYSMECSHEIIGKLHTRWCASKEEALDVARKMSENSSLDESDLEVALLCK